MLCPNLTTLTLVGRSGLIRFHRRRCVVSTSPARGRIGLTIPPCHDGKPWRTKLHWSTTRSRMFVEMRTFRHSSWDDYDCVLHARGRCNLKSGNSQPGARILMQLSAMQSREQPAPVGRDVRAFVDTVKVDGVAVGRCRIDIEAAVWREPGRVWFVMTDEETVGCDGQEPSRLSTVSLSVGVVFFFLLKVYTCNVTCYISSRCVGPSIHSPSRQVACRPRRSMTRQGHVKALPREKKCQ